jgi:hypothetical protein
MNYSRPGAPVAASVEGLTYWWFSDFELERLAQNAGFNELRF